MVPLEGQDRYGETGIASYFRWSHAAESLDTRRLPIPCTRMSLVLLILSGAGVRLILRMPGSGG